MKKFISVFLSTTIIFSLLIGCGFYPKSDDELIKNRIESFLEAYNVGDMDEVLNCLDSKTKNTYKSAMNITNAIVSKSGLGINLYDIFGLSVGVMSEGDLLTADNIKIQEISNDSAKVSAILSYTDKSKVNDSSENVTFIMKKEKSAWFIQDIK